MGYIKLGIYYILEGYLYIIILSLVLSWIPGIRRFKIVEIIDKIAFAYMEPFYDRLVIGPIDFTPIIGVFCLEFIIRLYLFLLGFVPSIF